MSDVTQILARAEAGDPEAGRELFPLVYDELRKLARIRMASERPDHTLSATALVHEAYLRLVGSPQGGQWDSRGHFFAAAAEAMRRILVDAARRKASQKRGGAHRRQNADLDQLIRPDASEEILEVDEALNCLQQVNPAAAKIVELRYFAGLTIDEAASLMKISDRTARRYWIYAKAWLREAIDRGREA